MTASVYTQVERGDRLLVLRMREEVLRCLVGSTAHGTGLPGHEDEDLMGIAVEPAVSALGMNPPETWVFRTQPEGVRSTHEDTDLTVYTLRKWTKLAANGNPSVLLPLFVADQHLRHVTPIGKALRAGRAAFVTKRAGRAFLGYMDAQRARMTGERGGKHTNRPELVDVHGYDTKYAMHMLRLAYQGISLMVDGTIDCPMVGYQREYLLAVRRGEIDRDEVLSVAARLGADLRAYIDRASHPENVDRDKIDRWLAATYQHAWRHSTDGDNPPLL